jgi:hypothetical protein
MIAKSAQAGISKQLESARSKIPVCTTVRRIGMTKFLLSKCHF